MRLIVCRATFQSVIDKLGPLEQFKREEGQHTRLVVRPRNVVLGDCSLIGVWREEFDADTELGLRLNRRRSTMSLLAPEGQLASARAEPVSPSPSPQAEPQP